MNKRWHAASENEVITYFDVNPTSGLSDKDVLARLKHFGNNEDPFLSLEVQKCMHATVLRNSQPVPVKTANIVPGDIIMLSPGDRVPADVRLLHVNELICNQTSITGDATAIKNTYPAQSDDVVNQKSMAFCGSFVVSGSAIGVVVARGKDTYAADSKHIKRHKRLPIKNTLLARRLRHYGIVIQHQSALTLYKDINLVFIEATDADATIIDAIRKVQLTQRISCKFIINRHQANRLARELNAVVWDIDAEKDASISHILATLDRAQFIIGDNEAALVKIASTINKKQTPLLWITDGLRAHAALNLADVSLVIGGASRGDVLASADLIAPKASMAIVTRILYNNK